MVITDKNTCKSLPRHGIGIKFFRHIFFGEQLHANDGEDVYDDDQYKCQVAESTDCRYDDAQQHFHGSPRLSQFQNSELMAKKDI